MTENQLIEWLVYNMECSYCPVYEECRMAHPKTCSGMLNSMLRASDDVVMTALNRAVYDLKHTKKELWHEWNPERRRRLQNHISKMRHDIREVRSFIGRRSERK